MKSFPNLPTSHAEVFGRTDAGWMAAGTGFAIRHRYAFGRSDASGLPAEKQSCQSRSAARKCIEGQGQGEGLHAHSDGPQDKFQACCLIMEDKGKEKGKEKAEGKGKEAKEGKGKEGKEGKGKDGKSKGKGKDGKGKSKDLSCNLGGRTLISRSSFRVCKRTVGAGQEEKR